MARGRLISKETKDLIAEIFVEQPTALTKQVHYKLERRLEGKAPVPGESAVQKELAKLRGEYRARISQQGDLDEPWSLGLSARYGIPREVIPTLLTIQFYSRWLYRRPTLTNREAKWVVLLSPIIKKISSLELYAIFYALHERVSELTGASFDTYDFDRGLATGRLGPTVARWMAVTQVFPESEKIRLGKEDAQEIEKEILGRALESQEWTGDSWWWYIHWLAIATHNKRWPKLSAEKREAIVMHLREWVSENQRDLVNIKPGELLANLEEPQDEREELLAELEEKKRQLAETKRQLNEKEGGKP